MRRGSYRSPYSPLSARQKTSEKKTAGSIQLVARLPVSTPLRIQSRLLSFVPVCAPPIVIMLGGAGFKGRGAMPAIARQQLIVPRSSRSVSLPEIGPLM